MTIVASRGTLIDGSSPRGNRLWCWMVKQYSMLIDYLENHRDQSLAQCCFCCYKMTSLMNCSSMFCCLLMTLSCTRWSRPPNDAAFLQQDLDIIANWETCWQMSFNPVKCHTIHITRCHTTRVQLTSSGTICWSQWHRSPTWASNWSRTWHGALTSARWHPKPTESWASTTSLGQHNIQPLVRPQLEYDIQVWSMCAIKETRQIENVQRRTTQFSVPRI